MKKALKSIEIVGHVNAESLPCVNCSMECGNGLCEKVSQYISSAQQVQVKWEIVDNLNTVLRFLTRILLIVGVLSLIGYIYHQRSQVVIGNSRIESGPSNSKVVK